MKFFSLTSILLLVASTFPAHAQSTSYLGVYEITGSTCIENGQPSGRAKAAVRFELKNSEMGRIFSEIDNADGVKGSATYFFDGGHSPFGAGAFSVEENSTHLLATAKNRYDGTKWIEKTESFEIIPSNGSDLIKVTRIQSSNYARNTSVICTFTVNHGS